MRGFLLSIKSLSPGQHRLQVSLSIFIMGNIVTLFINCDYNQRLFSGFFFHEVWTVLPGEFQNSNNYNVLIVIFKAFI